MLRPSIKGVLEDQVEEYMEDAGFESPASFVRYCVRKEIEQLRKQRIAAEDDR